MRVTADSKWIIGGMPSEEHETEEDLSGQVGPISLQFAGDASEVDHTYNQFTNILHRCILQDILYTDIHL